MKNHQKNHQIDQALHRISKRINLAALRPSNLDEEMKRFFDDQKHEPQFRYEPPHKGLLRMREELRAMKPEPGVVGRILKGIILTYIRSIDLILSRGQPGFTDISRDLYGVPDRELVRKARELIYLKVRPERAEYSTDEIIKKLRLAFVRYGFHRTIEDKNMIASAAVDLEHKKLLLKKKSRFSANFLKRIIVHEIGTHVVRSENGKAQPFRFFERGMPGYLMTEEGLAVYNEERHDCLNEFVLKIYAGRVLAIDAALKSSFAETYGLLRKYFTKNTAWRLALRAKRGMSDTGVPGAFTKDIAYLKGYLKVKEYIEKGGDMSRLYYGKVGIEHVDLLDQIPGLVHPRYLPMYRYMNFLQSYVEDAMEGIMFRDELKVFSLSDLELDETR